MPDQINASTQSAYIEMNLRIRVVNIGCLRFWMYPAEYIFLFFTFLFYQYRTDKEIVPCDNTFRLTSDDSLSHTLSPLWQVVPPPGFCFAIMTSHVYCFRSCPKPGVGQRFIKEIYVLIPNVHFSFSHEKRLGFMGVIVFCFKSLTKMFECYTNLIPTGSNKIRHLSSEILSAKKCS